MPFLTLQRLTMLVFFVQPIAYGSWLPRIPDIQQAIGLGPQGLALALLGLPCGTLLTLPFAGRIAGRIGPRRVIAIGFPLYVVAVCLPVLATSPVWLFLALMVLGCANSFLELGLNVEAAAVEAKTGSLIMSTSHGFWSLGIMLGSFIGSALAGLGLAPHWAVPLVALASLPAALWVTSRMPAEAPAAVAETHKAAPFTLPSWALLGVCFFVFGITMTEGAMADWSAVFMRRVFAADAATAGLSYTVFALLVAIGRFNGDWLRARLGAVTLARLFGSLGLVGVALLLVAPNSAVAFIGFGVVGIGASIGFPLAVSAVAALPGPSASRNVAVLSLVALLGFLVGPPVIGFIAEHATMRGGLAALLPVLALSLILTGRLRPASPPAPAPLPATP